ncbi:hypothetical protein BDV40DRAFT_268498, partial [Aspergillus tamarii]
MNLGTIQSQTVHNHMLDLGFSHAISDVPLLLFLFIYSSSSFNTFLCSIIFVF